MKLFAQGHTAFKWQGLDWNADWPGSKFATSVHPALSSQSCVVAEDHVPWGLTQCVPLGIFQPQFSTCGMDRTAPNHSACSLAWGLCRVSAYWDIVPPQLGGLRQMPKPLCASVSSSIIWRDSHLPYKIKGPCRA